MVINNFFAWIVTALVGAAIIADVRHDLRRLIRGRSVVLIGIVSWFLLEGITLSDPLREAGQEIYDYSIFCVFLSAAAFLVGYHSLQPTQIFGPVANSFRKLDSPELLWRVVLFCAIVGFAPVLYYSGAEFVELINGILGMRKSWGGMLTRGRYGGFREAVLQLENFVYAATPLAFILLLDKRVTALRKTICLTVISWTLLRAFGSGTRSMLISSTLPLLGLVYFKSGPKLQRSLILCGLLSMPVVYYFMAAIVASRGGGEFDWNAGTNVSYVGSEMLQEVAYIAKNVPENVPYQYGYGYYVQICNPIPRFIWPGKPSLDAGIMLAEMKGLVDKSGEAWLTTSPGLIGEMYLNFGLLGIIGLSGLGGWVVRGWDQLIELHSDSLCTMIYYSMGLATLFILGRSFTMTMFYAMIFLYIGVWLVTRWTLSPQPSSSQSYVAFKTNNVVPR